MTKNIMIVGVGGQGSLLASKLLGHLLLSEGYDVKVSEVHGMSQRGGSVVTYVILFGAIIYFMTIRPQKKQQKAADEMHAGMQAGDSVLTTSGFYGVIIDIMDDTVIVEFGNNRNCRIPMQKDAIAAVEKPNLTKTEEE